MDRAKQKTYLTHSPEETKELAGKIMSEFLGIPRDAALILALQGELGAGKTQFAQGVATFLGAKDIVTSPTFILMNRYELSRRNPNVTRFLPIKNLYHFDCYRIHSSKELIDLGWHEIIADARNVVLIEWPERIAGLLPINTKKILFFHQTENIRRIEF